MKRASEVPPLVVSAGRLPVTVPRRTEDLPAFNDYAMRGRTYRFAESEPLYPFGFGLSYAQIEYGPLTLDTAQLDADGTVAARVKLSNRSARTAPETVQCYLVPPRDRADAPRATLISFQKAHVPAHGGLEVEFHLAAESFRQVDAAGTRAWLPGDYELVIGPASPGPSADAPSPGGPGADEVEGRERL